MACVNCHRRSGMGTAEGALVVPAIVGSVLFAPVTKGAPQLGPPRTTGDGTRPAYTRRGAAARAARRRRSRGPAALGRDAAVRHRRGRRQGARRLPANAGRGRGARGERGHRPRRDHRHARGHRRPARLDAGRAADVRARQERRHALRDPPPHEWSLGHEAAVPGIPGLGPGRVGAARRAEGVAGPARGAVPPAAGLRDRQRDRGRRLVAGRRVLRAAQGPGDTSADAAASRRAVRRRVLLALLLEGRHPRSAGDRAPSVRGGARGRAAAGVALRHAGPGRRRGARARAQAGSRGVRLRAFRGRRSPRRRGARSSATRRRSCCGSTPATGPGSKPWRARRRSGR